MRVLWVKPGGFLPLDTGGKIRSYHTVKNLARHWLTTVITFYPELENDENTRMGEFVDKLTLIPFRQQLGPLAKAATYGSAVLHGIPFMFEKFCRPEVARAVSEELQATHYDVVICDFLLGCGVVPEHIHGTKVVFTHNVECKIWERHYTVASGLARRLVARREWRTLASIERKYLVEADAVLAVSNTDREEFVSWGLPPEKVTSVPTGVDISFFAPRPRASASGTIVFTGSMDWMPNQDGILWFLREVYPTIVAGFPEVRLKIVGRKPPAKIVQACAESPGASVTGWVEDVRDYLAEADVCIVPLRVGSGTRLKIFEAMSMGKAIVSTTIGAEGLPVTDQGDIAIADTPADFAARILDLLRGQSKRERMGQSARTLVETHYSWEAVTTNFMQAIEAAVNAKGSRSSRQQTPVVH